MSEKCYKMPINVDGMKADFISQELGNSEIPAILGLNGIERNEMMIIPHDEMVIIPNGGKVRISYSKEVRLVKCIRTKSGHLLLPCDNFKSAQSDNRDSSLTFFEGQTSVCKAEDEP